MRSACGTASAIVVILGVSLAPAETSAAGLLAAGVPAAGVPAVGVSAADRILSGGGLERPLRPSIAPPAPALRLAQFVDAGEDEQADDAGPTLGDLDAGEAPDPGDIALGAGAPAILTISVDRILAESRAGAAIAAQAEALSIAIQTDVETRREALRVEELELAADRGGLDRATFDARAAAFRARVTALRAERAERLSALQRAVAAAEASLRATLEPILVSILTERGAMLLLDERQVVLSARALDVTDEAISRLDAALPTLDVRVDTP